MESLKSFFTNIIPGIPGLSAGFVFITFFLQQARIYCYIGAKRSVWPVVDLYHWRNKKKNKKKPRRAHVSSFTRLVGRVFYLCISSSPKRLVLKQSPPVSSLATFRVQEFMIEPKKLHAFVVVLLSGRDSPSIVRPLVSPHNRNFVVSRNRTKSDEFLESVTESKQFGTNIRQEYTREIVYIKVSQTKR